MRIFSVYIVFFLLITSSNSSFAKFENKIVIRVENEIISSFEVKNTILTALMFSGEEVNQKNINKYKKEAINTLIESKLKKIEISKYNIRPNEKRMNAYLKEIALSKIDLQKKFLNNGLDFELYLERLNNEFMWQDLIFRIYSNKIDINENIIEKEINNYLKDKLDLEEFKVSKIDFVLEDNEDNDLKILELENLIKKNGFEKASLIINNKYSNASGSNLGWISSNVLSPKIYEILKIMKINEISKPIRLDNNIIFLKLSDKKISKKDDVDMEKLKKNFLNQKKNEQLKLYSRSYLSKLKNSSLIEYK